MSKIDDGGPAFPVARYATCDGDPCLAEISGMSLADHFAGLAMPGILSDAIAKMHSKETEKGERTGVDDYEWEDGKSTYAEGIASEAYIIAAAMIAEKRRREAQQ